MRTPEQLVIPIGFVSTFPPTRCGLATFTTSLCGALSRRANVEARIVRALSADEGTAANGRGADSVAADLISGDAASIRRAAAELNRASAAVIQHEYGIYGGRDGAEILDLLAQLTVPTLIVLHTVLPTPTAHQRQVLQALCRHGTFIVVMTQHARATLLATVDVPAHKVTVIPHGARTPQLPRGPRDRSSTALLTWGLISPGKGLEWSVRAVAELAASGMPVHYLIAGQTHPKLVAAEGEAYRDSLATLVDSLGVREHVTFVDGYLPADVLDGLIGDTDAVILPYESAEQATSGVLAEAVAARVPVIATAFPHAVELLSDGAGIVVPHRDPHAIAQAVATVIGSRPADGSEHVGTARQEDTSWTVVADAYLRLLSEHVTARAA